MCSRSAGQAAARQTNSISHERQTPVVYGAAAVPRSSSQTSSFPSSRTLSSTHGPDPGRSHSPAADVKQMLACLQNPDERVKIKAVQVLSDLIIRHIDSKFELGVLRNSIHIRDILQPGFGDLPAFKWELEYARYTEILKPLETAVERHYYSMGFSVRRFRCFGLDSILERPPGSALLKYASARDLILNNLFFTYNLQP